MFKIWGENCLFPRANEERKQKRGAEFDVLSAVLNLHGNRCSTDTCRRFLASSVFCSCHIRTEEHVLTAVHASQVRCCGWLQPWLEILPDILFTNQAQYTQYVFDNSNSHSGAHVNTHEVAQSSATTSSVKVHMGELRQNPDRTTGTGVGRAE